MAQNFFLSSGYFVYVHVSSNSVQFSSVQEPVAEGHMQICAICHPHPCCHVGQIQWDWNEHSTTAHYSTWVLWASEPASLGKIRYWWKQGCNIMIVTIYWNFLCSRHYVKIFVVVISQWLCNVNMLKKNSTEVDYINQGALREKEPQSQ